MNVCIFNQLWLWADGIQNAATSNAFTLYGYFMVRLHNFKIALFGLFLLTGCESKDSNDTHPELSSTANVTKVDNTLVGEWKYNNTIWYSSELTLNNNGTFTFHDQGCYGQRFSQGQWTNAPNSISLTSFDNFKPKEQIDNTKTETSEQEKAKPKSKIGDAEYSFVGFKNNPAQTFRGPNDTVRVYLGNIQLKLRNDTLYCVGSNKLPEEAKFYKTKNNR